ncbi:pentatricopeptide repeat-containing protein At2g13600-like [Selaginella moellendorffii]|nr:pentatricopeptide repeat-containing protein At2g13600-like [Selaginella moellendorffii]|eukprot:XP_024515443.1 pentatricopeptide repeat-containing protein At2g13600-like [Selaginella moellendorffii]
MWNAILRLHSRTRPRRSSRLARYISYTPILRKEENLQQAYADLIRYFTFTRDLEYARKLHGKIVDRGLGKDRYLLNLITEMYGKCGSFDEAKQVFDRMAIRDQMSWAAMITAGAESDDRYEEGLDYYRRMLLEGGMLPDAHILSSVLCCVETLPEARKIHDQVVSSGLYVDVVVMTGLINAYRRCGRLDLAGEVFDRVEFKDMVLWTSMLSAYSHSTDEAVEGLRIFWKMELEGIRPDKVTFTSLITATGNALCGCYAKLVDERVCAHGLEKDVTIASAMLYMHGKSGNLEEARKVFESMAEKNLVTWNSMIAACSFYGQSRDALQLFRTMDHEGVVPDHITFASVLDACADMAAASAGRAVHDRVLAAGLQADQVIVSALLNLYGKCGKVGDARKIFDECWKNLSCWNSMLTAYAQNGHIRETLALFLDMCHQGVVPDEITFTVLVAGCGHAGKVDAGRDVFRLFQDDYQVEALVDHYGCMVDVLGRNGKLQEAEELIESMPFYPDLVAWTAVLRACKNAKDVKRGSRLARAALETYPEKSGPYVMLSQIEAEIQELENKVAKKNGCEEEKKANSFFDCLQPAVLCACANR